MGTTAFNKLRSIVTMDSCCNKDNGFYMEDHFDLVDYGDQKYGWNIKLFIVMFAVEN